MTLILTFWHWCILGVVLLILELLTGGGFLFWIGLASLCTSLIVFLVPIISWPWQLVTFSALSLVTCLLWYRYLKNKKQSSDSALTLNKRSAQYIGRQFELESAIIHGRGRVKIGDTIWRVAGDDMPIGTSVRVISVEGVILNVEKSE